jgi:hypothetical protein
MILLFILLQPSPQDIFTLADSACTALPGVSYDFVFRGTGWFEAILPWLEGNASISGDSLLRLEFTESHGETAGAFPVPSVFHVLGDSVWFTDHGRQRFHSGSLRAGAGELLVFPPWVLPVEFMLTDPFRDEINADSIAWLGYDTLSGIPCHTLLSIYPSGDAALWSISTEDHLPRRVERISGDPRTPGAQILSISSLVAENPVIVAPALPEGYRLVPYSPVLLPGTPAPGFILADIDGMVARLADFRGEPLVLAFVSSWSNPSLGALALLSRLMTDYSDLNVATVFIWEKGTPAFRLRDLAVPGRVFVYGDHLAEDYVVRSVPVIYLLDREAKIAFAMRGSAPDDEVLLRSALDELRSTRVP